jgi:hypothetical protein
MEIRASFEHLKNNLPTLMKIIRYPEVRAAPNGIFFNVFLLFVIYNCAVRLFSKYTMSKASPGEEPVTQNNFACLKTSVFVPDYTKPMRDSARALASPPKYLHTWDGSKPQR